MGDRRRDTGFPGHCDLDASSEALVAVGAVFGSLGRGIVCADASFDIVHVSPKIEEDAGMTGAALLGRPLADLLGEDLFGEGAGLRAILERGEKREGWRARLQTAHGSRLVSLTVAPFIPDADGVCDPAVAYLAVLRPSEEDEQSGTGAPTMFSGLLARSAKMYRIFELLENLQASEATVLLTGESGTGKEVLARALHKNSPRRAGPFVAVNCAGLPGDLLESELFGHVRGAFTGAVRDRIGRFELAAGGTLFLDEIGDLPLPLQVKLLRVLQERSFERVGESRSRQTDARVVAATNANLRRRVMEGRFREDLYYRLRVVPIEIPPLRERREDIEPLARYLLERVGARQGRQMRFSPGTLRVLLSHPWPGNVRELENALEFAMAVGKGQTIHPEDLPAEIMETAGEAGLARRREPEGPAGEPPTEPETSRERERLQAVLNRYRWNRNTTAQSLGISRTTLWRRMREAGLCA